MVAMCSTFGLASLYDLSAQARSSQLVEVVHRYKNFQSFVTDLESVRQELGQPTSTSRVRIPGSVDALMRSALWSESHTQMAGPPCQDIYDMRAVWVKDPKAASTCGLSIDLSLTVSVSKAEGLDSAGQCLRKTATFFEAWDVPTGGTIPKLLVSKLK